MIWRCRDVTFDLSRRVLVMGIVNVTPDSFSDGGRYLDPVAAVGLRVRRRARARAEEAAQRLADGSEDAHAASVGCRRWRGERSGDAHVTLGDIV